MTLKMNMRAVVSAMVIVMGFMLIMAVVSQAQIIADECFQMCVRKCEDTTPYTVCLKQCSNQQCPPPPARLI